MLNSFSAAPPNLAPYTAQVPTQPLDELNAVDAPLAAESEAMDFSAEDRAPMEVLNAAIWQSVRGADSRMPEPRTSFRRPVRLGAASADHDDQTPGSQSRRTPPSGVSVRAGL
jgi:hypothetical protein